MNHSGLAKYNLFNYKHTLFWGGNRIIDYILRQLIETLQGFLLDKPPMIQM